MSCPQMNVTVTPPPALTLVLQSGQGPAGSIAPTLPIAVTTSRALTASDSGRILQVAHGVQLTIPQGLPAAFACQILMTAPQVWAGGRVLVSPANGVALNGSTGTDWNIERGAGSVTPWLAWLQHETGADSYSLIVQGAVLVDTAHATYLTLHTIGVN